MRASRPPCPLRAVAEQSQRKRLQALVRTVEDGDLPKLPEPDSRGNCPALPYARASLARKIIRRRKSAGLTQADLARRAGIRPETLSRLEKGKSTPDVDTVDKIIRVLERVEAKASP